MKVYFFHTFREKLRQKRVVKQTAEGRQYKRTDNTE